MRLSRAKEELDGYIQFLKKKGFIKEVTGDSTNSPVDNLELEGLDIASL